METSSKKQYQQILQYSQKFKNFSKLYNRVISGMPEEIQTKFAKLTKINNVVLKNGKEQWQILDITDSEMFLSVKKADTIYQLTIFNKDLTTLTQKDVAKVMRNVTIDENCVAIIEATNTKKNTRYFIEIDFTINKDKAFLIEKECSFSQKDLEWCIQPVAEELNEEEIAQLLNLESKTNSASI